MLRKYLNWLILDCAKYYWLVSRGHIDIYQVFCGTEIREIIMKTINVNLTLSLCRLRMRV